MMKDQPVDQPFVYKGYTKQELAQMYNPYMKPRGAIETFNKWLRRDPVFWAELNRSGVDIQTQYYRKSQVRLIVDHLGDP